MSGASITLSYSEHNVSRMAGSENLNDIAHVTIAKRALRVAYSNEAFCYASPWKARVHQRLREREQSSLSLHLVVWHPLRGCTSEEGLQGKTGCMGPCAQAARGAAWRTTMETRSVTGSGGIHYSCRHCLFDRLMKTSPPHRAQQQQQLLLEGGDVIRQC